MNIILEGPDNTGKSTLARYLVRNLSDFKLITGEGPEKYPGEINERIERLSTLDNCVFDRHSCVSHPIYSKYRTDYFTPIDAVLLHKFYQSKPLFIHCKYLGRTQHVTKEYDTPEHLSLLEQNFKNICLDYRNWAFNHALILYAMSSHYKVLCMIQGIIDGKPDAEDYRPPLEL